MSLPCILIIDDQYASDSDERALLLANTNSVEITTSTSEAELARYAKAGKTAGLVFCRGQAVCGKAVCNDYGVIHQAVADGWGTGRPWRWALVLLDVMFVSGATDNGLPSGQEGDDHFGEETSTRLAQDQEFTGLPLVMLTSKEQRELKDQRVYYLSKKGLDAHILKSELLRRGVLADGQTAAILQLEPGVLVHSPAMKEVFRHAFVYARTKTTTVLLLGETGVGKEVVARYIHKMSSRQGRTFFATNAAEWQKSVVESQLFGHEKGSFTGAQTAHKGYFELASGGTLFLDEIGEIPLDVQPKLLRALQEREISPVGGQKSISIDIRLISATSADLPSLVRDGLFRGDLYYRINTVTITIPPLRDRKEEIPHLVRAFLQRHMRAQNLSGEISVSEEAMSLLQKYHFPGNVRELLNLTERIVVNKGTNTLVFPEDIEPYLDVSLEDTEGGAAMDVTTGTQRYKKNSLAQPNNPGDESSNATISPESSIRIAELERTLVELRQQIVDNRLTLKNVSECLDQVVVSPHIPAESHGRSALEDDPLWGIKPVLEAAIGRLLKRIAGAALEGTKHFPNDTPECADAVRRIEGNTSVAKTKIPRTLKAILGRTQTDNKITEEEINELIEAWRSGPY